MSKPASARLRSGLWLAVIVLAITASVAAVLIKAPGGGLGVGSYSLVDQAGRPVDQAVFSGHPSLLFFGYSHCPYVCPTTMSEMAVWFSTLGEQAGDLRAYFVTVDPERDTPAILGDYVTWISDRITGLTGSRAEIDKIIAAWHVVAEKVPGDNGDYTVNHTASVFLLNRRGEFEGTIGYGEAADSAVAKIRRLLTLG